jgi:alkylated DNA repair dioxygenase AlkB
MELFDPEEGAQKGNILPYDGEVYVIRGFFNEEESAEYFKTLLNTIEWKQDEMKMYGKIVKLPRLTAWYGDNGKDYSYSGIEQKGRGWTKELQEIRERIQNHSGIKFTSVLCSLYRNGNDSVSWHRDNEKVLRVNPVIASVSFGATRVFRFRHVDDHSVVRSVELTSGTYVLMKGETQHKWEHQIPASKKILTPRISLTFRILF